MSERINGAEPDKPKKVNCDSCGGTFPGHRHWCRKCLYSRLSWKGKIVFHAIVALSKMIPPGGATCDNCGAYMPWV